MDSKDFCNDKICITPFKEIHFGTESIYDYVEEGYTIPNRVIMYLQRGIPFIMCPGIYKHPFKENTDLLGPYLYEDGEFYWDRDTWKYATKYNVKLPQAFIDKVMSERGLEFLKERISKQKEWSDVIGKWKENGSGINLLPDSCGDMDLNSF